MNDWNDWNGLIPAMNGAKRLNDWNGWNGLIPVMSEVKRQLIENRGAFSEITDHAS